eukprot:1923293-Pyramimonas_sp.AAC.1
MECSRVDGDNWPTEKILELPAITTPTGKNRKTTRLYKLELLKKMKQHPALKTAKAALAGMKIWGRKGKG